MKFHLPTCYKVDGFYKPAFTTSFDANILIKLKWFNIDSKYLNYLITIKMINSF